ncbi:mitochondrial carrier domain-containing protein, partial [Gorgonomyces haynaldii]
AGILAGHPLDTVKVRLQAPGNNNRGILQCFVDIVKRERITGLYKGMTSPLVGVAFINSMLFAVYGSALRMVSSDLERPALSSIFYAGSISGLVNAFFSAPIELIKIRLQNDTQNTYKGPLDCVRKTIQAGGIRAVFKGLPTTFIRETPSYGAYFASYEYMTRVLLPDADPEVPSPMLLFAGGFAGVIGWASTYPFDVIKTRIQGATNDPNYRNMRTAFATVVKNEGYGVFFRGLGACSLRAFPTNAATFYTV